MFKMLENHERINEPGMRGGAQGGAREARKRNRMASERHRILRADDTGMGKI